MAMRHRNVSQGGRTRADVLLALTGALLLLGVVVMVYYVAIVVEHPGDGTHALSPESAKLVTATPCPSSRCPTCAVVAPQESVAVVPLSHVFPYRMRIVVFTYNRLEGLKQLIFSLLKADYPDDAKTARAISLHIFMDYPKKSLLAKAGPNGRPSQVLDNTRAFLAALRWPHGPLEIHRREGNVGLKKSIMEGWYPTEDSLGVPATDSTRHPTVVPEFCAFFEDDIEVSRDWFSWSNAAIRRYAGVGDVDDAVRAKRDPKMLGLSLFRPIKDELSGRKAVVENGNAPFILQQPCSWGAVYFPWLWREFRDWYSDLPPQYDPELVDPSDPSIRPSSNTWDTASSWKKYLIQRMHTLGWFMVYPNPPGTAVLSTNHLLKGEHPTPPRKFFELPLYETHQDDGALLRNLPPLEDLDAFDVMFAPKGKGPRNLPNYATRRDGR